MLFWLFLRFWWFSDYFWKSVLMDKLVNLKILKISDFKRTQNRSKIWYFKIWGVNYFPILSTTQNKITKMSILTILTILTINFINFQKVKFYTLWKCDAVICGFCQILNFRSLKTGVDLLKHDILWNTYGFSRFKNVKFWEILSKMTKIDKNHENWGKIWPP